MLVRVDVRLEVIAAGETDWQRAVAGLLAPVESPIFYQKQMTHHLLPHIDRGWMAEVRNCFLIRDPREVLLSYAKKRARPLYTSYAADDIPCAAP